MMKCLWPLLFISHLSFAQTACEKRELMWNEKIIASKYTHLPKLVDIDLKEMFTSSLRPKIESEIDYAPTGWNKSIHKRAVVGKIKFIPEKNLNYTGIFQGNDCGLIRLSLTYTPEKRGVAPGLALKFFRNLNAPSANVSMLTSLDSQGQNYNFFRGIFTNVVPFSDSLGAKIINKLFSLYSSHPNYVGVKKFSQIDINGSNILNANGPVQLFLIPNRSIKTKALPARDFRIDLMKITKGTKLFDVMAIDQRDLDSDWVNSYDEETNAAHVVMSHKVGTLVLDSEMIASEFGDNGIFFKHETLK